MKRIKRPAPTLPAKNPPGLMSRVFSAARLRGQPGPAEVWVGEPKTVLFLVGPGHTGSTLLNFILGSHSRVFGAGEISKLRSDSWKRKHEVHSTKCAVCVECAFWPGFLAKNTFKDTYLGLLSFVGAGVIVDSSKSSTWAAEQGAIERGVTYRYVRLIRDGRGCAASYRRKGQSMEDSVRKWAAEERQTVDYFERLDPDAFVSVKYEALASQTKTTVEQVCKFLGIEFESKMVEYWRAEHHPLGGNAGSKTAVRLHHNIPITTDRPDIGTYIEKGSQVFLDERWRDELTERDKEVFERIAGGLNRDNGYDTQ